MPTYEYRCQECGHEFELYQAITAPPAKRCPACGKRTVQRLIGTGGGIIFKGSGFYQTDYRSEAYKKAAEAETKVSDGKAPGSNSGEKAASSGDTNKTPQSDSGAGATRRRAASE